MNRRWIDPERFPGRAFLAAVARDHRAITASGDLRSATAEALQARWAARLGAEADDLLLFASAEEAARLACSALLLPHDVALLARPSASLWPASALATGAAFVDVGRLADGRLDPAGIAFAAESHPGGLWLLEQPSLAGQDDVAAWSASLPATHGASACPAALVDVSGAPGHGASVLALAPGDADGRHVLASLHALRDPLEPAWPTLYALRVAPGQGRQLAALLGGSSLPMPLLERASAALSRADEAADRVALERIATVVAQVNALAAGWSGAAPLAGGGWRQAVRCDAGDSVAFAEALAHVGLIAAAYGRHPMRSYVVVDLGLALQLGRDRGPIAI